MTLKKQMKANTARQVGALEVELRLTERRNDLRLLFLQREIEGQIGLVRQALAEGVEFEIPQPCEVIQQQKGKADIPFSLLVRDKGSQTVELMTEDGNVLQTIQGLHGIFHDVSTGIYRLKTGSRRIVVGVGDVFLVAGQSNALSSAQKHEPYYSQTDLVSVSNPERNPVRQFVIPTRRVPIRESICWLYCGDMLAAETKTPLCFVNLAVGSTSSRDWHPDSKLLFERIEHALQIRKVKAVLWHQGESDVLLGIPEQESFENLKAIIEGSRKLQKNLRWVVALNSSKTENAAVRRAQQRIIKLGLAFGGPDTDALRHNPAWVEKGGGEFIGEGLKKHGELWYEALRKLPE